MAAHQTKQRAMRSSLFILGLFVCLGLTASAALADTPLPPGATPQISAATSGGSCALIAGRTMQSIDTPQGSNYLRGTDALASNDVWAVGFEGTCDSPGCVSQTLIEHWDGTRWTLFPAIEAGSLNAVRAIASNDVWAVGSVLTNSLTLTMHWDGIQWDRIPTPTLGTQGVLNGVAAASANDVWAVGYSQGASLVLHWNGAAWSVVQTPDP